MSQPTGPQPPPGAPRPPSPTPRKRKLARWMPQKTARRRMKQVAELAFQMLELALTIASGAAGDAGVPGLSTGLEALLEIIRKIQAMKTNVEGVEMLATRITSLKDALEKLLLQHQQLLDEMRERIDVLSKLWERIAEDAQRVKCRGMIKRFFTSNVDATTLQGLVQEVSQSIENFLLQSMMHIEAAVHAVRQDVSIVRQDVGTVRQDVGTVLQDVGAVRQDVKAVNTHLEMSMLSTYAKRAQYNSSSVRRECLEGTRKDVLADAYSWIHKSSEEVASCTAEEKSGHFLWINGWAGTGKTTIACSVAKKYDDKGVLGANFFCSRTDAECRDPNRIFVTIARQLCQYHEPFKEKVMAALKKTPDVVHAKPLDQFKALILQPLRELEGAFPTCVIVIDALDECENTSLKSVILDILARHIRELSPFLFVVTSRPEPHITAFFEKANEVSLKDSTTPLVLHNVHLKSALDDIRHYLIDGFKEIRETFTIEADWPSIQDMDRLTALSKGLFIFATTVLRFIGDTDSDPKEQLQALLTASVSIMHDLYREVLALAFKDVNTLHKTNPSLRRVLGAITLAEEPLSAAALADLLGMPEGDVRNRLARLRSVLHVPEEGSKDTIRFIHPTFPEFLLDASLDKPEAFHIIPAEHHLTLFMRSLVAMDGLKRNIARIERSAAFRSEVPGLSDTVKRCIPAHVAYASRFWSIHLSRCASGTLGQDARDLFSGFLTCQMLYWLEACSLLRVLDGALTALETAEHICQNLGGSFASLVAPLSDYHRFLWMYYFCIDSAPLQVYHSALAVAPTESLARKEYARELDGSLVVRNGALCSWPSRRDSFTGHDGKIVYAITFSSGGDCFVTVGGDHRLKMWKASTRTMVQSFDGHTGDVYCVAISPDGVHVASGSSDRDVCVWQVSSGECVLTLKGHTDWVTSLVYSSDGRPRLLSATQRGEVRLWDTADGRSILTLNKTGNYTLQAGLSPDGGVIARGSGASLSLYHVSAATDEGIEFTDTVEACTFSPDGGLVAARSPHVIRVWQRADKSLVRSIHVPEMLTSRLAFSRDGTRIACGSENGSVFLWQVASQDPPLVLPGHTAVVQEVAWSPDGMQVASASRDGTIRVCDATESPAHAENHTTSQSLRAPSGTPRFALTRHKGSTVLLQLPSTKVDIAVAASMPEGAPTLALFADLADAWDAALQTVEDLSGITCTRLWAVITGQQHVDFSASLNSKQPVCISPDGLLLAYRSPASDRAVDVCELRTGKVVVSLTGHTGYVTSITFSPDSTLITTGSTDGSVNVQKATTGGNIVHSHKTHKHWVQALAFSSNGRIVASGSYDESVHVFEAVTGRIERVFEGHRHWIMEVVFAAEDRHVIALDYSNWVYIWDIATGTRTYEIHVDDDFWARSITPSPETTSLPVTGDNPEPRVLPLCNPGSRTWPEYVVSTDGWIYAASPGRTARLGWLPPEWRTLLSWEGAIFRCLDQRSRTAVEFDVSRVPDYVRLWGPDVQQP